MSSYSGIIGAVDIVAAIILWLYASNLSELVWVVIIILLYQGFTNLMKMFV
ncbi:MAG TPA: hypothetical protein VI933_01200 [archaeon]|nr:hypothetical protein [archaeon]